MGALLLAAQWFRPAVESLSEAGTLQGGSVRSRCAKGDAIVPVSFAGLLAYGALLIATGALQAVRAARGPEQTPRRRSRPPGPRLALRPSAG